MSEIVTNFAMTNFVKIIITTNKTKQTHESQSIIMRSTRHDYFGDWM